MGRLTVTPPAAIWKFDPAVIALAVIDPEPINVPPLAADHRET
jgi:hypothetical protein